MMDLEATARDLAPRLLRYCRGRVDSPALAEEAAQDALAALVAHWRRDGPPRCPEAFAFTIARRRVVRSVVRERLQQPLAGVPLHLLPVRDPHADVEARSELDRVRRDLGRLSRREREALLLVVAAELPLRVAAAVLDIGESALKMRLARARRRLTEWREESS